MTDNIKTLDTLLDAKLKPIHGELARINHELSGLKFEVTKVDINVSKNSRELARLDSTLTTVDENLTKMGNNLVQVRQELNDFSDEFMKFRTEATDKIDALMVEFHDFHQNLGIPKDQFSSRFEKLEKENAKVQKLVGMSVTEN